MKGIYLLVSPVLLIGLAQPVQSKETSPDKSGASVKADLKAEYKAQIAAIQEEASARIETARACYHKLLKALAAREKAKPKRDFLDPLRTPDFARAAGVKVLGCRNGRVQETVLTLRSKSRVPWGKSQAECDGRTFFSAQTQGDILLERKLVSPQKPLLINTVDRREGGCPVMVMKDDFIKVQPLPSVTQDGAILLPASID
ncbi:MAG: hypothetical protein ABJP70_10430 [Erythrobacter sp.]